MRFMRPIYYGMLLFTWLVLCALGLETCERIQSRPSAFGSYAQPIVDQAEEQDMAIFDATAATAPRPPAEVVAKYPVVEKIDPADDATMLELARQWEAVIVVGDIQGTILRRFTASSPATIAEFGGRALKAVNLRDLVPKGDETHWGGVAKLETFIELGRKKDVVTEFIIPLDCAPKAGFRFLFHPFTRAEDGVPVIATVITEWRWPLVPGGFRPNYYERDTYPAFRKSEFWTNSLGFRTHEIVQPKPKGVYRILCIGGSTTMEGPRNDLTYPVMFEELLRAYFQIDAIEVINAGVDGAPVGGTLGRFDEYLALEPDFIIHYNFVNDVHELINDTLTRTILSSSWKQALVQGLAHSQFVRHRCGWLWDRFMPKESDYRAQIEQDLMPYLQKMNERAKIAGVRFAISSSARPDFAHLPAKEQAYLRDRFWFRQILPIEYTDYIKCTDAFNGLLPGFCQREGALYVPAAEHLTGGMALFLDHCHFHVPGLRRKAEIMFETLKDVIAKDLADKQHPATSR